ncbi:hypothetical protein L7F22_006312 [Adiantum nelumboides]|nr:hypothetical protein [Adiantum nelumboides]
MPNWISGCRLKKYHLPLTTDMLAKIHSAKERKNKLNDIKAEAQEEAKIRILKRKQKLQQQRQPLIEESTPFPLAAIQCCDHWQIGIDVRINVRLPNGQYQRALVDTGARVNVVNHSTYKKLTDQPLMQCSRNIAAANKEIIPTMGFINLNVNIDGNLCPQQFLVVTDDGINESMCLGVPWMRTYNAIPEWSENSLLYTHNSNTYMTPFAKSDKLWQLIPVKEQTTVSKEPQTKTFRQIWVRKKVMENNPRQIWIPKSKVSTTATNQRPAEAKSEWKWQPKVLTAVQHFDEVVVDPLRADLAQDLPLSSPGVAALELTSPRSVLKGTPDELAESAAKDWENHRKSILRRFSSNSTIKVSATLDILSKQLKGRGQFSSAAHLQELDEGERGTNDAVEMISQEEYVFRLRELNDSITRAWKNNERVATLRLAVKVAKLLSDTSAPRFYPTIFILATDILETIGNLVWKRIKGKAEQDDDGKLIKPLPENFTADDVCQEAKDICSNWFYKIGAIQELLPRLYLEITILHCMHFL